MAKERRQDKTIEELRQQIAHTRDRLGRDLTGLRYELDLPLKFRKSFQRHSGLWISAVTLLGTLFTIRPSRRRKTFALKGAKKGEAQKKGANGDRPGHGRAAPRGQLFSDRSSSVS